MPKRSERIGQEPDEAVGGAGKAMNRAYGDIWLGDLLTALSQATHADTRECIAWGVEMLGLPGGLSRLDEKAMEKQGEVEETITDGRVAESQPDKDRATLVIRQQSIAVSIPYAILSRELPSEGQVADWQEGAEPLPELTEDQLGMRPSLEPLFNPKTSRALISTAFATQRNEGEIDYSSLFERICALRPVTELPRLPMSTLRFGIQLLIDRGQGTWPYYADQELIRDEILGIVGRDRVETLYFADSPLRGYGPGRRSRWRRPYVPPAAGTPVVVLTDLGIARRRQPSLGADEAEWLAFAERVNSAECPLLALVPYGESRWPASLRKAFYLLTWDRATHVSMIRRIVGHGLQARASS